MIALLMTKIFNFNNCRKKRVLEVWATKKFIKDKMSGRGGGCEMKLVDIYHVTFFCSCDFIFNFFEFFSKICQGISTLSVILFFMKFCVAQTFWVERPSTWLDQKFYKTCKPKEDSLKKLWWLLYNWGIYLTFWTLKKEEKKIYI